MALDQNNPVIARIREKCRVDGLAWGQAILVGDRTRARLGGEIRALQPGSTVAEPDWCYSGEIVVMGVAVRTYDGP